MPNSEVVIEKECVLPILFSQRVMETKKWTRKIWIRKYWMYSKK